MSRDHLFVDMDTHFVGYSNPSLFTRMSIPVNMAREEIMAIDDKSLSTSESLRQTRTYGQCRCHNPSCMGRFKPEPGQQQVKCPECGMEYRVFWMRPDFPRLRGPVWDANRKLAEDILKKLKEEEEHAAKP
jgi:hypothetical protein